MATVKKKPVAKRFPVKKAVPQPAKGRRVDWDAVERDYRTGKFTLREMGDKYGVTHAAIGQKARKMGWTADLSKAIKQATNAKLIAEVVSKEVSSATQSVSNTVLAVAEINKQIILGHRTGLNRLSALKEKLLMQIEQAANDMPNLSDVIEMARSPDEHGKDRLNDALRKAMSRSTLADDLKTLTDVDEKVRRGEREAFRLNEEESPESELAAMSDDDLDARTEKLLERHRPRR